MARAEQHRLKDGIVHLPTSSFSLIQRGPWSGFRTARASIFTGTMSPAAGFALHRWAANKLLRPPKPLSALSGTSQNDQAQAAGIAARSRPALLRRHESISRREEPDQARRDRGAPAWRHPDAARAV